MSAESKIPPALSGFRWWPFNTPQVMRAAEGRGSDSRPGRPDRVLIIEDDVLIATQMQNALSDAGFNVLGIAATGDEALELLDTRKADLAVVDIRLAGGQDGIETALKMFRLHGTRCIFASAYSDAEARRRAEPAAPLGWLPKPYTMTSLVAAVRRAVDGLGRT